MLVDAPITTEADARSAICELGRRFYDLGWVSGTGGGISLRVGDRVIMAPSGVQKELLAPDDMFVLDLDGQVTEGPHPKRGLRVSECRPLFMLAYTLRDAGAVIHSHSQNALMATLIVDEALEVSRLEMMKGIRGVSYDDTLVVPVIENTAHERDLASALEAAMRAHPNTYAVLVRRHGVYVWGQDWREAKRHAECYDYLFGAAVEMRRLGILGKGPLLS
jgi:methylthioribulose-1-phosphate dehydratase